VGQDRVELAGEALEFAVGQGEPGETREVSDVVPRYLRHVKEA
jgi:hypothetical protein